MDDGGNVFVADAGCNALRKIDRNGQVSTLSGKLGTPGNLEGPGPLARLREPFGLGIRTDGTMVLSDAGNHELMQISASGFVTSLAGTGQAGSNGPGSTPVLVTDAVFNTPQVLTVKGGSTILFDSLNGSVRELIGSFVTPVFSSATPVQALLQHPFQNNLIVVQGNKVLSERADLPGFGGDFNVGSFAESGTVDGTGSEARFIAPSGLALGLGSTFYVVDFSTLRSVDASNVVTTLLSNIHTVAGRPRQLAASPDGKTFFFTTATAVVKVTRP